MLTDLTDVGSCDGWRRRCPARPLCKPLRARGTPRGGLLGVRNGHWRNASRATSLLGCRIGPTACQQATRRFWAGYVVFFCTTQLHHSLTQPNSDAGTPEEVLSAVASGVDVMEGSYPLAATQAGWALSFQVDPPTEGAVPAVDASVNAVVNLWSREFAEDGRPLVEGCGCFACSGYTRAYVHHLLETHEMLAGVLLELHNTHHWLRFMAAMRAAIVGGRFELYKKAMLGQ